MCWAAGDLCLLSAAYACDCRPEPQQADLVGATMTKLISDSPTHSVHGRLIR